MSINPVDSSSAWYLSTQREPSLPPLTNTADLLGLSAQDIAQAQKDGKSLSDLAAEKGISTDDVIASVTQDLEAALPQDGSAPSSDQIKQMATTIANHKLTPDDRITGDSGDDDDDDDDDDRTLTNLSNIAQSMGLDLSALFQQLSSGGASSEDIATLLAQTSSGSNYGSSLSDLISGGLSIDTYA